MSSDQDAAELLDQVRERLLAMVGLPRYLMRHREEVAELCELVGLRVDRSDERYWRILRPGHSPPRMVEDKASTPVVQPDRYIAFRREVRGWGWERWFTCRECSGEVVTDRFVHDRWHNDPAMREARDARLAETLQLLFAS